MKYVSRIALRTTFEKSYKDSNRKKTPVFIFQISLFIYDPIRKLIFKEESVLEILSLREC